MATRRWCVLFALALLAACSNGSRETIPGALPVAPMGVLGPRAKLRIAHLGRPHYFFNRFAFEARGRALPHSPYDGPLLYGGGPVEHVPVTYLIFWGWSGSTDAAADPDGLAPYMVDFFQAIPASSWLNTVTQYYQDSGTLENITNPASQYGGATYDPAAVPATYTDAQAAAEAVKVAGSGVGYSTNANYVVVTPHSHTISGFKKDFCAYHSAVSTTRGLLSYTVFPYVPDAGYGCGANSVPSGTILDGVSIVGGHEEAEAITDPDAATGWGDANGYEIADKCAWYDLQSTPFSGGNSYATQPLWSNAATSSSACVQGYSGGPLPSPGGSPTPSPSGNVIKNPGFETGSLKPWTSCRSNRKQPVAVVVKRRARTGKYDAYAGTLANEKEPDGTTSVCQLVTIPANGRLIVWVRGVSDDKRSGVYQFGRLYSTSRTLAKTLFAFNANDKTWVKRSVSLAAYAGGRYLLAFGIQGKKNAHGRVIGLYIDDVSLAP